MVQGYGRIDLLGRCSAVQHDGRAIADFVGDRDNKRDRVILNSHYTKAPYLKNAIGTLLTIAVVKVAPVKSGQVPNV